MALFSGILCGRDSTRQQTVKKDRCPLILSGARGRGAGGLVRQMRKQLLIARPNPQLIPGRCLCNRGHVFSRVLINATAPAKIRAFFPIIS